MSEFGQPAGPPARAAASPGGQFWRFLDANGMRTTVRPAPTFDGSIGATGGALVAVGVILAAAGDDGSRGGVAVAGLALVGVGVVVRLTVAESWRALRTAAVAAGLIGIIATAAAAASPSSDDALRTTLLLATIGYVAAWLAPGYRGHPAMLGAALLSFAGLVATVVAGDDRGVGDPLGFEVTGFSTATGHVLLLAGLAYLVGVWAFDRRGYVAVGTACAAASLATITAGTGIVATDLGDSGGSLLVLLVGVVVCAVGARSDRRATAWWGGALSAIGGASFVVSLFDPSSSGGAGMSIALTGVALIAAATLVIRRVRGGAAPTSATTGPSLPPPTVT